MSWFSQLGLMKSWTDKVEYNSQRKNWGLPILSYIRMDWTASLMVMAREIFSLTPFSSWLWLLITLIEHPQSVEDAEADHHIIAIRLLSVNPRISLNPWLISAHNLEGRQTMISDTNWPVCVEVMPYVLVIFQAKARSNGIGRRWSFSFLHRKWGKSSHVVILSHHFHSITARTKLNVLFPLPQNRQYFVSCIADVMRYLFYCPLCAFIYGSSLWSTDCRLWSFSSF